MGLIRSDVTSNTLNHISLGANTSETQLVLDANGKVGVGTQSPGATLHISGGVAADKGLIISGKGNQSADLFTIQDKTGATAVKVDAGGSTTTTNLTASIGVSGSSGRFGDVKIAGSTLSVEGNSKINQDVRSTATGVQFGGTLTTSAVTASSTLKVAGALTASNNTFFVDPTTARVGVNAALPDGFLHVSSSAAGTKGVVVSALGNQSADLLTIQN
jgi:hypothetical protein